MVLGLETGRGGSQKVDWFFRKVLDRPRMLQ